MRPFHFILAVLTLAGFAVSASLGTAAQDENNARLSDEVRVATGLRNRRLFQLAVNHCNRRLAQPNLDSNIRVELCLELIKTYTAEATVTEAEKRGPIWEKAFSAADDFFDTNPNHPKQLLIAVQKILTHQARGRALRQEIEADIAPPNAQALALQQFRLASRGFEKLESEIDSLIPKQRRRTLPADELTVDELNALKNNLRFQSAITNLNRAQLFPPTDQLNRIDTLNQVASLLDEVKRISNPDDSIWWETQFRRVECFRLLGESGQAVSVLQSLPLDQASDTQKQGFLEQYILTSIEDKVAVDAALEEANRISERTRGLDLAILKLMKFKSLTISNEQEKDRWLGLAEKQTQVIEQHHGPYWGRRAELILIGANMKSNIPRTETNPNSTQVAILERVGDQAARKGRHADAIKAYDQAIAAAIAKENRQAAFVLNVKAAKSEEALKQHQAAAERLIQLANRQPAHRSASSVHLRGCWNLYRTTKEDKADAFRNALRQNLETWPGPETADQARVWLAGQYQATQKWSDALSLYMKIRSVRWLLKSMPQIDYCIGKALSDAQKSASNKARNDLRKTLGSFDARLAAYRQASPGPEAKAIAQAIGELELLKASTGLPLKMVDAAATAQTLAEIYPNSRAEKRPEIAAWTLAAIAVQSEPNLDSQTWLDEASKSLEGLQLAGKALQLVSESQSATLRKLEALRVQIIQQILDQQQQLTALQIQNWISQKAFALIKLGRDQEAVGELETLATSNPNSASTQIALARTYTRLNSEVGNQNALKQWRLIAGRVKSNTENWFEAKYHVALMLEKTGQRNEAKKLLRFIKAIPPGWEESSWKTKLDQLLRQVEN